MCIISCLIIVISEASVDDRTLIQAVSVLHVTNRRGQEHDGGFTISIHGLAKKIKNSKNRDFDDLCTAMMNNDRFTMIQSSKEETGTRPPDLNFNK